MALSEKWEGVFPACPTPPLTEGQTDHRTQKQMGTSLSHQTPGTSPSSQDAPVQRARRKQSPRIKRPARNASPSASGLPRARPLTLTPGPADFRGTILLGAFQPVTSACAMGTSPSARRRHCPLAATTLCSCAAFSQVPSLPRCHGPARLPLRLHLVLSPGCLALEKQIPAPTVAISHPSTSFQLLKKIHVCVCVCAHINIYIYIYMHKHKNHSPEPEAHSV